MPNAQFIAIIGAVLASMLMGAVVVSTRFVVPESDPLTVTMLRYVVGLASMAPCYLLLRRRRIARADLFPVLLLGAVFFGAMPYLFTISLKYTYASHGGLMIAFGPLLTLGLSSLLRIERPGLLKLGGLMLAMVGAVLSLGTGTAPPDAQKLLWLGDGLMLGAMAGFAVFNVFSRPYLIRYGPLLVTLYALVPGTLCLVAAWLVSWLPAWLSGGGPMPSLDFSPAGWAAIVFIGFPGGAWGFLVFIVALRHLSPTRAAVFFNLNPLTAAVLATLMLGEALSGRFLTGFVLVLAGIVLAQWRGGGSHKETATG
ncbi:MAG: DMT family transporter [bacterium]